MQQCVISGAGALALLVRSSTRPSLTVSWPRLRELARIGLPLTASTLVYHCRYRLFALLIGATAGAATLGQVHMAFRLIDAVRELVFTAQWRLMLPMLSEQQQDLPALHIVMDRCLAWSSFVAFPLCAAMAVSIQPLVTLLLGPVLATLRHRFVAADRVDGVAAPCIPRRRRRHCPRRAALYADRQHRRHGGHRVGVAAPAGQPLAGGAGLAWCAGLRQSLHPVGERTRAGDNAAATASSRRPLLTASLVATAAAFALPLAIGEPLSAAWLLTLRLGILAFVGIPLAWLAAAPIGLVKRSLVQR